MLRISHCLDSRLTAGSEVSLTHRLHSTPHKQCNTHDTRWKQRARNSEVSCTPNMLHSPQCLISVSRQESAVLNLARKCTQCSHDDGDFETPKVICNCYATLCLPTPKIKYLF
jgi:hypothetical protein